MNAESIERVAVLGLGTMGHGIAQMFATAGLQVSGYDDVPAARDSLADRVAKNLQVLADADLLKQASIKPILARIQAVDTEEKAVAKAQFVTEAVREDLATKQALFARLEKFVSDETILASNSSTIPISQSGAKLRRPERAIVTHWVNPPHIVPVVEVVRGPRTSDATTQTALALMRRLGKQAVLLNKEIPGFVLNRLQVVLWREIWDLLDRGVISPEDMDTLVSGTLGFRLAAVGPLEVSDFGGLELYATIFNQLAPDLCAETKVFGNVRQLVEAGHHGVKSGKGFYEYTPQQIEEKRKRRDERFLQLLRAIYQPDHG